jgi:hypothetical protein
VRGELVLQTLRVVWQTIEPLNTPVAVVGGMALAAWKHVRATKDIDLLLGIGPEQLGPVLQRLSAVGIRPKRNPPIVRVGCFQIVQLLYEPPEALMDLQIDLLLADSEYFQTALKRRVPAVLPNIGIEIAVLACEDLILQKLLAGRMIDLADTVALLRANQNTLDAKYMEYWAQHLSISGELARVRQEAAVDE